jgi:hypothetical protein
MMAATVPDTGSIFNWSAFFGSADTGLYGIVLQETI